MSDQRLQRDGAEPGDCNQDLGFRVKCFDSPRIQFPCNAPIGIRPDTQFVNIGSFPQLFTDQPRWYTLKTSAYSIERRFAGAGPTPSTRDSDLLGGDFSAAALKLSVTDGENNNFVVDIAQGRNLSVMTRGLHAQIQAPPGATRVENTSPGPVIPAAPLPFFMCDSMVNVSIFDGPSPLGARNATLSRLYAVTGVGGTDTFQVPARAQRVQFSLFAPLGVVTPLARFATNAASPTPARLFYSTVQAQVGVAFTPVVDVPGDANSVDLSVSGIAGTIMAVWEISW